MTTNIAFANIRNRAEQHNLNAELNRIEKEKQNELRLLKTEKLKFRSKYSKVSGIYSNEPSEVRMYDTHNPGFCYRRNGEQRVNTEEPIKASIDFEHIHHLIFTDGEVDVNKILCLHLISAHRTETLTPPKRKISYICKEHSPLERLIDRSKKGYANFENLSNLLPLYTLEIMEPGAMGESASTLINDGRLAARILVNEKVRELMSTVVSALEQSNTEKLEKLSAIAHDTSLVRKMLKKPETEEFIDMLLEHSLINSCESYILTPPFKIKTRDFDIKTLSGGLEHLIKHIRQNVLQISSQTVWSRMSEDEVVDTIVQPKISSSSLSKSKMEHRLISDPAFRTSRHSRSDVPVKKPTARKPIEEETQTGRSGTNYIARNIEAAAKVKRIEYDVDEEEILPAKRPSLDSTRSRRRSSESSSVVAKQNIQSFLPPVEESIEEESTNVEQDKTDKNESEPLSESASIESDTGLNIHKKRSAESRESKYHIKQTTCPACMEKWKTPLPPPKTPRVKKSSVLGESEYPVLKTNSQHRVSMLISKEMYKLQSYDRKYSAESEAVKAPVLKKKENEQDRLEVVHLNPMDLAKIEQEIKEKETQKKLEKFLKEVVQ